MSDGTRENLFLIHLSIDGRDLGVWDAWSGGDKDTDSTKYRSGGESVEESLGGPNTYSDLTISRNYRLSRDNAIMGYLFNKCGIGTAKAQKQPLDRSYKAFGKPIIGTGVLKTVTDPKVDSNANNAAMVEVVIELNSLTIGS